MQMSVSQLLPAEKYQDFTIECAGQYDGDFVALVMSSLLKEIYPNDLQLDEDNVHKACNDMLNSGSHHVHAILAFDGDKAPAGIIMMSEGSAIYAGGRLGIVTEFVIMPHYRSLGLGEAMVKYAYRLAQLKEWLRLAIVVPGGVGNRGRVMRYFKRHGFQHHGAVMQSEVKLSEMKQINI